LRVWQNPNKQFQPIVPHEENYDREGYLKKEQQNYPVQTPNTQGMMQNPFDNAMYTSGIPDVPMPDMGAQMLNALLSDEGVPEDIKKNFWFVFHRDNTLTFLDNDRKFSKLLNFDILKIDSLNAIPYYNYTFSREMEWDAARHIFETKLDRALGDTKKGMNERIAITANVSENITRSEGLPDAGTKQGFLKRILNRS
jgi:hypothetical protein